jgi:hypothetical protein
VEDDPVALYLDITTEADATVVMYWTMGSPFFCGFCIWLVMYVSLINFEAILLLCN